MQKTFSYTVSDKTKEEMIEYFQDKKRDKTPQYAVFQANEEDTIVTLYDSNKVVFQGISADIDAEIWKQREYALTGKYPIEKEKKEKKEEVDNTDYYFKNTIGSDEVGTGDFFGPIVVTASYVNVKDIPLLEELGVKDSKKITDNKIIQIAPTLLKKIPHITILLNNLEYNNSYSKELNMNKIKAILHNKTLYQLKNKNYNYDMIVVDQFAKPFVYFSYLKELNNKVTNINFTTKAESKCLSVACSSIISRYIFLKEMKTMSEKLGVELPKGSSSEVDKVAKAIVDKYGKEKLKEIAKLNFKNMERI
ncbi:MAG: ribonuclease HIII [Bacilli bacterium]|jgi:ribonuclease HIII|nr:ribonuclease HIII [Bacilli bacterium]